MNDILEWVFQWLVGTSQFVVGWVLGTLITGVFTWKVIIPKILANPKVARLLSTIEKLENYAEQIAENWEKKN
jgi:uncharacterized membrane protein YciS (DUF1049 family)